MIVGRRKGCGLRIPSAEVSRTHCKLSTTEGYLTVEDLDSANGTLLNGEPVTGKEIVRPGDRLQIGPATFVVQYQLTQAAIDRMLQEMDVELVEEEDEVFAEVVTGGEESESLEMADEEAPIDPVSDPAIGEADGPLPVEDSLALPDDASQEALAALDDAGPWQAPAEGDLRDILSQLDQSYHGSK
jgi:pSer/pThr/pTyr-binding forkhead associated (FHA) protein